MIIFYSRKLTGREADDYFHNNSGPGAGFRSVIFIFGSGSAKANNFGSSWIQIQVHNTGTGAVEISCSIRMGDENC
jgi:hypothetical protein